MTYPAWALASPARRWAYRLLGPALSYFLHLRPAEWPIMAGHTLLGYLLATGWPGATQAWAWRQGLLGLALWVVCLNGGTLAINSAFDKDEGDVGYLRRPPPPPRYLLAVGLGLMAAGQGLAFLLPREFAWAYGVCFLLSVAYSVPPLRLKAVAGADLLINMWGFGTLTPYAGWAATGLPLPAWGLLVLLAFAPLFAALYPLTQLYQFDEDQRRGDRTLALRLGMGRSLDVALAMTLVAFALLGWAGRSAGWDSGDGGRWSLLAFALLLWLVILLPWRSRFRRLSPGEHQHGMYRALGAWAVTDVAVLLAFGL